MRRFFWIVASVGFGLAIRAAEPPVATRTTGAEFSAALWMTADALPCAEAATVGPLSVSAEADGRWTVTFRAAVAYEMGDYARALADYEKAATEKEPQWGERGDCLFALRDFAGAASAYAKWQGQHPRERLIRVAQANAAIKNYPAAIAALEKALRVTRDEAQKTPMRYQLARLKGLMK